MVVDTVVLHWESLVEEEDGGDDRDNNSGDEADQTARQTIRAYNNRRQRTEGGHTRLEVQEEFFHTDNGMVAYTDPGWIQTKFDMLTRLFDQVGLKTNVQKTVGMVFHP